MNLSIREWTEADIDLIIDYFSNASEEALLEMGAEKSKLPERSKWYELLQLEVSKIDAEKNVFYFIWLLDDQPIGHSNINDIKLGDHAFMHLHLWLTDKRKSGIGSAFVKLCIRQFFERFQLKTLYCEPYAHNPAPAAALKKLGFELIGQYEGFPGILTFKQLVSKYELTKETFEKVEWPPLKQT
ncbi:MAG: GNAT family protein [Cyclobacteriaceae bacterium]